MRQKQHLEDCRIDVQGEMKRCAFRSSPPSVLPPFSSERILPFLFVHVCPLLPSDSGTSLFADTILEVRLLLQTYGTAFSLRLSLRVRFSPAQSTLSSTCTKLHIDMPFEDAVRSLRAPVCTQLAIAQSYALSDLCESTDPHAVRRCSPMGSNNWKRLLGLGVRKRLEGMCTQSPRENIGWYVHTVSARRTVQNASHSFCVFVLQYHT